MQEIIVLVIMLITLFLFIRGKLRYDFVSLLMVVSLVVFKVVSPDDAFLGFSNPAIITITSVLVISQALIKTKATDRLVTLVNKGSNNISFKIMTLMAITALLSAFMNNVGALALVVPITLKISKDNDIEASKLLMPVSFSSLLGGMLTTIGTPPNLIVSSFREEVLGEGFKFFSFFPIAIIVVLIGIVFTSVIGYKLIPRRDSLDKSKRFNIEDYLFELRVTSDILDSGVYLKDFFSTYNVKINIVSIFRKDRQITNIGAYTKIYKEDVLIVKALSDNLNDLITKTPLSLVGAKADKLASSSLLRGDDVALVEVVLRDDSPLIGRTTLETKLRNRYNANLIAVSRGGIDLVDRLKNLKFQAGDILLLQAPKETLNDLYTKLRSLPINEQGASINITNTNKEQLITVSLFSVSVILSALNIIPVHIAFLLTALILVMLKVVTPREFYDSIEWPSIIMIGSLFSLGLALETSGLSNHIATFLINISSKVSPNILVVFVMIMTIILTNIINNTAATIIMAPIAVSIANVTNLNLDPLLISIVVGAAMSFITPIAHQSNMLVMGPGGYKFTDYYKLGLPLVIISVIVSIPLILLLWPL